MLIKSSSQYIQGGNAMSERNVNYGFNYGHIGDQLNIYQNIQIVQPIFNKLLGIGGANNSKINFGLKNLLMLELFNKHCDNLEEEFEKFKEDMKSNRYPLKIRVTQLVNDCAQGIYYNNGNVENDVWEIVDSIFTLVCTIKCGSNFYAKRVYVGSHFYYEVYPLKG